MPLPDRLCQPSSPLFDPSHVKTEDPNLTLAPVIRQRGKQWQGYTFPPGSNILISLIGCTFTTLGRTPGIRFNAVHPAEFAERRFLIRFVVSRRSPRDRLIVVVQRMDSPSGRTSNRHVIVASTNLSSRRFTFWDSPSVWADTEVLARLIRVRHRRSMS